MIELENILPDLTALPEGGEELPATDYFINALFLYTSE